ncbi:polysaccharide deacetylase family protein [Alkalimarinus coralli]|uniref:polysaccharide deacetylase family protein n=1 Tax=Alkalimarinus coralli TaxID=2935863 RepID=UPI00202B70F2|nr:polysaccharide deacetylase family protein [Alkalimarinus coralli]
MNANLKKFLKRTAVKLFHLGSAVFWGFNRGNLIILTYHRVLPDNSIESRDEQPGMIVNPETFDMHLRELNKRFEIVDLEYAINNSKLLAKTGKNYCAITFDDGWKDNFDFAFPLLKKHNVPATIFLVSSFIETSNTFWPGRLIKILNNLQSASKDRSTLTSTLPDSESKAWLTSCLDSTLSDPKLFVDAAISNAKSLSDSAINQHLDKIEEQLKLTRSPSDRVILNWDEIDELTQSKLIKFGCHTKHHTRINHINNKQLLKEELVDSKHDLEKKLNTSVSLFCYPNGDQSTQAEQVISEHYSAAVTTCKGLNKLNNLAPYTLKRITMHQGGSYDAARFSAKITGRM